MRLLRSTRAEGILVLVLAIMDAYGTTKTRMREKERKREKENERDLPTRTADRFQKTFFYLHSLHSLHSLHPVSSSFVSSIANTPPWHCR